MIDKTRNTGQQFQVNRDIKNSKNKLNNKASNVPQDAFKHTSVDNNKENFIIIPPKNQRNSSIYKGENDGGLEKFNVSVDKDLGIIGGYAAKLDDKQKEELTKAGYNVFEDKKEQLIQPPPGPFDGLEKIGKEGLSQVGQGEPNSEGTSGIDKTEGLQERPKLDGPRFDTPLTQKYNGEGVTIAVIDSGMYPHPDLTGPDNRLKAFVDLVNGREIAYDDNGHGTHVAGDAVADGGKSEGLYAGPAKGADIVAIKAMDGSGRGNLSSIIGGIQYCIKNKDKLGIKVINMSLGHTAAPNYQDDPVNLAVKAAYEAGITVVAAAGNEGPKPGTIGVPGDSPHSISVGAFDDNNTTKDHSDDKMVNFSSRGPTVGGLMKPDVVAPGEGIVSTSSPGSQSDISAKGSLKLSEKMKWYSQMPDEVLQKVPNETLSELGLPPQYQQLWHMSPKFARGIVNQIFKSTERMLPVEGGAYTTMPGTSMASPRVAGVVACMLQANPDLSPGQISEILKNTADKLPGEVPATDQGAGAVDPQEAIQMALDVKEGKINIEEPVIDWPESTRPNMGFPQFMMGENKPEGQENK